MNKTLVSLGLVGFLGMNSPALLAVELSDSVADTAESIMKSVSSSADLNTSVKQAGGKVVGAVGEGASEMISSGSTAISNDFRRTKNDIGDLTQGTDIEIGRVTAKNGNINIGNNSVRNVDINKVIQESEVRTKDMNVIDSNLNLGQNRLRDINAGTTRQTSEVKARGKIDIRGGSNVNIGNNGSN